MTLRERCKRAKGNIARWSDSTDYSLDMAYGRCSEAKREAWRHCEAVCREYNGRCLKVISHNTHFFTAGFEFDCPSTGVLMFMYITPTYETVVEM